MSWRDAWVYYAPWRVQFRPSLSLIDRPVSALITCPAFVAHVPWLPAHTFVCVFLCAERKSKTGLLFKSIVQKPHYAANEEDDTLGRFTMLYLTRFKDNIRLEEGCRLEV